MTEENPKIEMMNGTESQGTYGIFARNGNVVLGVRLGPAVHGSMVGVPSATYFMARLRSARLPTPNTEKVVKLVKNPDTLASAWPGITFEKEDETRASVAIGCLMEGNPLDDQATLLENIGEGKLVAKMTEYLIAQVPADKLAVSEDDLRAWVNTYYQPWVETLEKAIKKTAAMTEQLQQSMGSFNSIADLTKKAYDKLGE